MVDPPQSMFQTRARLTMRHPPCAKEDVLPDKTMDECKGLQERARCGIKFTKGNRAA